MGVSFISAYTQPSFLELPLCYGNLFGNNPVPVGPVLLKTDCGRRWMVGIVKDGVGYKVTCSWCKVAQEMGLPHLTVIVFKHIDATTFNIRFFYKDHSIQTSRSFCYVVVDTETSVLPIPRTFVRLHLGDKDDLKRVLVTLSPDYSWKMNIRRTGQFVFLANGVSQMMQDFVLKLRNFLVFDYDGDYTFKVTIFDFNNFNQIIPAPIVDDNGAVAEQDVMAVKHDLEAQDVVETIFTMIVPQKLRLTKQLEIIAAFDYRMDMKVKLVASGRESILQVAIDYSKRRMSYAVRGWNQWLRANNIKVGDVCCFSCSKVENVLVMNVVANNLPHP